MSTANEGFDRIFQVVLQMSGSDEIVTFQTAVIFYLAFVVMMSSMTMNYRSYSSYRSAVKILEAKATRFFENHGIEKETREIGFFNKKTIENPYLNEINEDNNKFPLFFYYFT